MPLLCWRGAAEGGRPEPGQGSQAATGRTVCPLVSRTGPEAPEYTFPLHARPTPVQQKAFDLLGVDPARLIASNLTG